MDSSPGIEEPLARLSLPELEIRSVWSERQPERLELDLSRVQLLCSLVAGCGDVGGLDRHAGMRRAPAAQSGPEAGPVWQEALALWPDLADRAEAPRPALRAIAVARQQGEGQSPQLDVQASIGRLRCALASRLLSLLQTALGGGGPAAAGGLAEAPAGSDLGSPQAAPQGPAGDGLQAEGSNPTLPAPISETKPGIGSAKIAAASVEVAYEFRFGGWIVSRCGGVTATCGALMAQQGAASIPSPLSPGALGDASWSRPAPGWSIKLPLTRLALDRAPFQVHISEASNDALSTAADGGPETNWLAEPVDLTIAATPVGQPASQDEAPAQRLAITLGDCEITLDQEQLAIMLDRAPCEAACEPGWLEAVTATFGRIAVHQEAEGWGAACPRIHASVVSCAQKLHLRLERPSWLDGPRRSPSTGPLFAESSPAALRWAIGVPVLDLALEDAGGKEAQLCSATDIDLEACGTEGATTLTRLAVGDVQGQWTAQTVRAAPELARPVAARPMRAGEALMTDLVRGVAVDEVPGTTLLDLKGLRLVLSSQRDAQEEAGNAASTSTQPLKEAGQDLIFELEGLHYGQDPSQTAKVGAEMLWELCQRSLICSIKTTMQSHVLWSVGCTRLPYWSPRDIPCCA